LFLSTSTPCLTSTKSKALEKQEKKPNIVIRRKKRGGKKKLYVGQSPRICEHVAQSW
jgi:hypothetical protein